MQQLARTLGWKQGTRYIVSQSIPHMTSAASVIALPDDIGSDEDIQLEQAGSSNKENPGVVKLKRQFASNALPLLPDPADDSELDEDDSYEPNFRRSLQKELDQAVTKKRKRCSKPKPNEFEGRAWDDVYQNMVAAITKTRPLTSEVFSIPRLVAMANEMGSSGGASLDIRNGWNALKPEHQERAIELLLYLRPYVTMLSPPCTLFSALMRPD